jgi:hypothetical protein
VRTLAFIVGGLFLFGLLLLSTPRSDHRRVATTCLAFVIGWFIVALGNLIYGVTQAGYPVAEELPIALLIFLPPAIPAVLIWSRNRTA